jgi:putative endonuclease
VLRTPFTAVQRASLCCTASNVSDFQTNSKPPVKLQYCVYVLYSLKDKQFYIGFTFNLKQRLTQHFQGRSRSTSPRLPLELVFCEYFLAKEDAVRRERYFKTTTGKRTLRLMLQRTLFLFAKDATD